MLVNVYRLRLSDGSYLSAGSIQSTKDKYKALMCIDRAEQWLDRVDGEAVIENVALELKPCKRGGLRFNFDDTYGIESVEAFIIHETAKYIYTVEADDNGQPRFSSVQKHKKSEAGTVDFQTGEGFIKEESWQR